MHTLLTLALISSVTGLLLFHWIKLTANKNSSFSSAIATYQEVRRNPDALTLYKESLPSVYFNGKRLRGVELMKFSENFGYVCAGFAAFFAVAYALTNFSIALFSSEAELRKWYVPIEMWILIDAFLLSGGIGVFLLLYSGNSIGVTDLAHATWPSVNFIFFETGPPDEWLLEGSSCGWLAILGMSVWIANQEGGTANQEGE